MSSTCNHADQITKEEQLVILVVLVQNDCCFLGVDWQVLKQRKELVLFYWNEKTVWMLLC